MSNDNKKENKDFVDNIDELENFFNEIKEKNYDNDFKEEILNNNENDDYDNNESDDKIKFFDDDENNENSDKIDFFENEDENDTNNKNENEFNDENEFDNDKDKNIEDNDNIEDNENDNFNENDSDEIKFFDDDDEEEKGKEEIENSEEFYEEEDENDNTENYNEEDDNDNEIKFFDDEDDEESEREFESDEESNNEKDEENFEEESDDDEEIDFFKEFEWWEESSEEEGDYDNNKNEDEEKIKFFDDEDYDEDSNDYDDEDEDDDYMKEKWNFLKEVFKKNRNKDVEENVYDLFEDTKRRNTLLWIINEVSKKKFKVFDDWVETLKDLSDYYIDDLNVYNVNVRKFPMSWYIDFWKLQLKEPEEINTKYIKNVIWNLYWVKEEEVKSVFFYKWRLYTLFWSYIDDISEWYFLRKIREMHKSWDKDTVLVWYDLLENKLLASTIVSLLHYSVMWITQSWKTEYLKTIVTQYLAKNNFKVVFLEKGTDLNFLFERTKDFVYKNNVISMKSDDIINIFTYLWLEIFRRNKEFQKYNVWNIIDYNEIRRKEWEEEMYNLLFVIDEFAKLRETLSKFDKKVEENFIKTLWWFIAIFRSFWIYFVAATQAVTVAESIPSIIQNNLATKILWYAKWANRIEWINDLALKRIAWEGLLRKWDFIIQSETIATTIFRSFFVSKLMYETLLDEWIIKERDEEEIEYIKQNWTEVSANRFLSKEVERLLDILWIDILDTSRFSAYWVDIQKMKNLNIWSRIALTILFNLVIDWFEEQAERITEKNVAPKKFYVENVVNRLMWKQNNKYAPLWFVMSLIIKYYNDYLDEEFKNIKFPKNIHKAAIDEDWTDLIELKEETLREIQNIIEVAFQNTIESLLS